MAEPAEHGVRDAKGGIASGQDATCGAGAGKEPELAVLEDAVGVRPCRPCGAVIVQLGTDQLAGNPADMQGSAVAQRTAQCGNDVGRPVREQFLDAGRQRSRKAERGVDCGRVAPGLHRGDELATDAGAVCQLGLREPALQSALTQRGLTRYWHEPGC